MLNWLHNAWRRRKAAEALYEFRFLIAAPRNLGTGAAGTTFTFAGGLPGPGRVAISGSVGWTSPKVVLAGGTPPTTAANIVWRGRWLNEHEPLTVVTVAGLAAQTLKVYVLDEWDHPKQIATATVT